MWAIIAFLIVCGIIGNSWLNTTKWGALLIWILGVLIMGFRSVDFTGDNEGYVGFFILNSRYTIAQSWQKVIAGDGKDPFFYFLGNFFAKLGFSFRGWFIFIALVFMSGFCYIMYKHSKNYFLSGLMLVSLSYFYFAMTGLRQALAIGLCCFATEAAYRKKLIPFLALVALAGQFHSSAWIFLLVYVLRYFKPGYKYFIAVASAGILALMFPGAINAIIKTLAWNERIAGYAASAEGLSPAGFVLQFSILIFCFAVYIYYTLYPVDNKNNVLADSAAEIEFDQFAMSLLFVGAVIQAFAINVNNIFRMSMYFSIAGTWLVPNAIYVQTSQETKRVFYISVSVALIGYFLLGPMQHFRYLTFFGGV